MTVEDLLKLLQSFAGLKDALFGIPIVAVVWALTQGAKNQFSLTGKTVEYVSFGIGLVVGMGYKMSAGIDPTFAWWFQAVIYGALMGVIPSLLYKTSQDVIQGAMQKLVNVNIPAVPKIIAGITPTEVEKLPANKDTK